MKANAPQTPFAAMNHQERSEQWIWWHCQQDTAQEETITQLPDVRLPGDKVQEAPEVRPINPQPRHDQYTAVIRRMNQARRNTTAYISCTEPFSMTMAHSAGSENAEK